MPRRASNPGEAQLIIGTHALIQEDVQFFKLGLVIVDEQHRFGVGQRLVLRNKGLDNHSHGNQAEDSASTDDVGDTYSSHTWR
jgi:RecG-like helicase